MLTQEDQPFIRSDMLQATHKLVVELLTNSPILAHFDDTKDLVLETNASCDGLGAVLFRISKEEFLEVLAYARLRQSNNLPSGKELFGF